MSYEFNIPLFPVNGQTKIMTTIYLHIGDGEDGGQDVIGRKKSPFIQLVAYTNY